MSCSLSYSNLAAYLRTIVEDKAEDLEPDPSISLLH